MLYANLAWHWPSGSWAEDENVKKNRSMAEQMNDRQSEKFIWAFSSSELKREWHKLRTWHKNKRETDRQRNNQRELYIGTSKDNERRRVCEHRALAKKTKTNKHTQHKKIISQTQSTFSAQFHSWIIQNWCKS